MLQRFFMNILITALFAISTMSICFGKTVTLTITNHYPKALMFGIKRNNEVVPDLKPTIFFIQPNQSRKTVVSDKDPELEAYIAVDGADEAGQHIYGFWGVMSKDGVHGYTSRGIAFNWDGDENQIIMFCHPRDYPCISHSKGGNPGKD